LSEISIYTCTTTTSAYELSGRVDKPRARGELARQTLERRKGHLHHAETHQPHVLLHPHLPPHHLLLICRHGHGNVSCFLLLLPSHSPAASPTPVSARPHQQYLYSPSALQYLYSPSASPTPVPATNPPLPHRAYVGRPGSARHTVFASSDSSRSAPTSLASKRCPAVGWKGMVCSTGSPLARRFSRWRGSLAVSAAL
jgi:hypothetical protein